MRKAWFAPVVLMVFVAVALWAGSARVTCGAPHGGTNRTANETYMVIQVGDEYRVIRSNAQSEEKKRIEEENKRAKLAYEDARKSDPNAVRPVPKKLKIVKSGFKTEQGGRDFIEKVLNKGEGKDKPKTKIAF